MENVGAWRNGITATVTVVYSYITVVCRVHITKLNVYNVQYSLPATILLIKEQHLKNHLVEFSQYSV
jgi:hypothetical protein